MEVCMNEDAISVTAFFCSRAVLRAVVCDVHAPYLVGVMRTLRGNGGHGKEKETLNGEMHVCTLRGAWLRQ